jgi:hypothetical protein
MMQLNRLQPGDKVKSLHEINAARIRHWKYITECADVGGGIMPGVEFTVTDVHKDPTQPWVRLKIPFKSPDAFLKVSGQELATVFTMNAAVPVANKDADLKVAFDRLKRKQFAAREGFLAIREAREQLRKDYNKAKFWGSIDVFCNAAMVPLNVIVNAFEVKAAKTIYEKVVEVVYQKYGKSGTRIDGDILPGMLSKLKEEVGKELLRKGLRQHIPGVNIIVGLAEDSVALFQSASRYSDGDANMRQLMKNLDTSLKKAEDSYLQIGKQMAELLKEIDIRSRTA